MFDHLLLVSPRGDDVISRTQASVWRFSEVNSSAIYTSHRLFELYFYIIIFELFSLGSVLCV